MPYWTPLKSSDNRKTTLLVFGVALISLAFTLSHTVREAVFLSHSQFDSTLQSVRGSESVGQWLPAWTNGVPKQMKSQVETENRVATIDDWQPEHRLFHVSAGDAQEARVRTYFYPLWHASANGKALSVRPAKDGALLISLPPQAVSVALDFKEPTRVHVAAIISLSGWVLIVVLLSIGSRFLMVWT